VLEIIIPPLKERVEDIVPIAKLFIDQNNKEFSKKIKGLSEESEDLLKEYHWPGNVRELKNVIERACILCQEDIIQVEHLAIELQNISLQKLDSEKVTSVVTESPNQMFSLQEIEKNHIIRTLDKFNGNKSKAARVLQISRSTLREKLRQYGIN